MRLAHPERSKNSTSANFVTPSAKRVPKLVAYSALRVTEATPLSRSQTEIRAQKSVPSDSLEIDRRHNVKSALIRVKRAKIVQTFV